MAEKPREPVDIIVIGYNLPDMESDCLRSVVTNTKWPFVLTYYDNYKTGRTLTAVWNWLIRASSCGYICLLNSDAFVHANWLPRMMQALQRDPKVGFVGPSTNNCHSPQKEIDTFTEAEKYAGKEQVLKDPISGFCLLFRKALWQELKGFDERYDFYGQESDFIDRAQRKGYRAVWRKDAFVYHIGQQSIKNSDMDVDKERAKAKALYWSERKK